MRRTAARPCAPRGPARIGTGAPAPAPPAPAAQASPAVRGGPWVARTRWTPPEPRLHRSLFAAAGAPALRPLLGGPGLQAEKGTRPSGHPEGNRLQGPRPTFRGWHGGCRLGPRIPPSQQVRVAGRGCHLAELCWHVPWKTAVCGLPPADPAGTRQPRAPPEPRAAAASLRVQLARGSAGRAGPGPGRPSPRGPS